jgi:hypothetical protein
MIRSQEMQSSQALISSVWIDPMRLSIAYVTIYLDQVQTCGPTRVNNAKYGLYCFLSLHRGLYIL